MPLRFACPQCSQKLSVSSREAGTTATCPRCQKTIAIPKLPARVHPATGPGSEIVKAPAHPPPEAEAAQHPADDHDHDNPFSQFTLYDDDAELYYDTDEPLEEIDADVDYNRVAVPRAVLYMQGALLAVVGLFCFGLGLMAGGTLFTRSEPAGPTPVRLSGTVSVARGSRDVPDTSAVVVVLPQTEQLDERAPWPGMGPKDPPPEATHRGLEIIRTIGGSYARTDEQGRFDVELPNRGKYFVLVLSAEARRRASTVPPTEDVLKMGRYFEEAADFLGQNRYQLTLETLRSDKRLNVVFD